MASKSSSFYIASVTDLAEVQNACNQTMLEIRQRFDFKASKSQVEIDMKTAEIKILSDDAHKLYFFFFIILRNIFNLILSLSAFDVYKFDGEFLNKVII